MSFKVGRSSVNFLDFVLLDKGVLLREFLLLLREVVESAAVALGVTVLRTVDVATLAGQLDEADLLVAIPALVAVSLKKVTVSIFG